MSGDEECVGVVVLVARMGAELELLFLRRSGGRFADQWWPVTGTLAVGEDPVSGALRELAEETGLAPDGVYSAGISVPHAEEDAHLEVFVAVVEPDAAVTLNWEHSGFRWCSAAEARALSPASSHRVLSAGRRIARARPPSQLVWPAPSAKAV